MSSASTKAKQIKEPFVYFHAYVQMLAHMKKVGEKSVLALAAVVATLLMLPSGGGAAPAATTATGLGNNSCTRICGNISVPYPFGVEPGCYHATGFNLTCNHSFQPPKLFLGDGTVEVLDISVEHSTVHIYSPDVQLQYDGSSSHTTGTANGTWGLGLPEGGPFFLSESASILEAIGCGTLFSIRGGLNNTLVSSCTAICPVVW
jgi:hypothetical protein